MIIYYTVEGNRYNISEGFGCQPALYLNWHAILACYAPSLLVGCISFVYGGTFFAFSPPLALSARF